MTSFPPSSLSPHNSLFPQSLPPSTLPTQLLNGKECVLTDTVGLIHPPPQLPLSSFQLIFPLHFAPLHSSPPATQRQGVSVDGHGGVHSEAAHPAGELSGEPSGDLSGELSGGLSGDLSGELSGGLSGGLSGELSADLSGELSGELSGGLSGELSGELSGGLSGDLSGDLSGELSGELHPMAAQQVAAVLQVLAELEVSHIPMLTVLNKVDQVSPGFLQQQQRQLETILDQNSGGRESSAGGRESSAGGRESSVGGRDGGGREDGRHRMVAVSAVTGEGMDGLFEELEKMVNGLLGLLVSIEAIIPYQEGHLLGLVYQLGAVDRDQEGHLLGLVYQLGAVDREEHLPEGTLLSAHVPLRVAQLLFRLFISSYPFFPAPLPTQEHLPEGTLLSAHVPLRVAQLLFRLFISSYPFFPAPLPTQEHLPEGTLLSAHVPLRVAQLLLPYRWTAEEFKTRDAPVA
ncbi:unnamed protein product [Closterium sp. Naga37s-1]|nr:unnamed protein product [Closterium sp. Naga37s-1]